jgi:hypothetical protein
MERFHNKIRFTLCLPLVVMLAVPLFADQFLDGWSISTGNNGVVTMMSYSNPRTYLNIQEIIKIRLNNQGSPASGSVRFKGGLERDLTQGEVTYYWEYLKGDHALWEFLALQGRLNSFNPQTGQMPDSYFGKMTRVVTKSNSEIFGRLERPTDAGDFFMLQTEGACCGPVHFEKNAVSLIEQMK